MSAMTIKGDFYAGTDIKVACVEACALANRIRVCVKFDFNGVHCVATPGGSPDLLEKNWHATFDSKSQHKMAFSR